MKKLQSIIEKYSRWEPLKTYVERIDAARSSDFSIAIENAKALLETIGKQICNLKQHKFLSNNPNINTILKNAFLALDFEGDNYVMQISTALSTIGQNIGNLRNKIGTTSHGHLLEELKERNESIDEMTREFLMDSTITIAIFLIRSFEEQFISIPQIEVEQDLIYDNCQDFNDYLDNEYPEYSIGNSTYTASEILFYVDYEVYKYEYKSFVETDQEQLQIENNE
jgi:hypothetical protein